MFEKIKKYIKKGVKVLVGIVAVIMMINTLKNCNSGRNNSAAICASAEEIDVPDIMDGTIDDYNIENYPTANYFDINLLNNKGVFDRLYDYKLSNGLINSIIITTTSNSTVAYLGFNMTLGEVCPEMKTNEYYILNFKTNSNNEYIYLLDMNSGSGEYWYINNYKLITEDLLNRKVCFYALDKETQGYGTCTISEIMINKGTTAYPYTPYYKTLYNAGYTDGEKTGYDSGIIKGQSIAKNGIFADATISGYILFSPLNENDKITFNYENNQIKFVSGGIDFYQFAKTLENQSYEKWGDDWETTYMNINLKEPVVLSSLSLFGQGNSTSFFGAYRVTDTSGNIYSINWINDDIWKTDIPEDLKKQNINISKISFQWGGGVEGMEVTIYQEGIGYEAGFADGYNQGKDEGYDSGYNIGNKQGYDSGYKKGQVAGETIGYDKAVNEGMSGTGLLFGIFSFIKVFFKLMTQLLSVKVAGDMTVALFVIGIPAAGMIINWVIRLVQNLATGGNGGGNSE